MLFTEWLQKQMNRDDAIGELASQLVSDATGPIWSNNPEEYRSYLRVRHKD